MQSARTFGRLFMRQLKFRTRNLGLITSAILTMIASSAVHSADMPSTSPVTPKSGLAATTPFTTETLSNGLRVIYAPMPSSPVVHVRVFYHVGSKDERSDRNGFAHMFEHMMFRGSEHVAPEVHMKLLQNVGGYSNAYTSFDETVYINTVPATFSELPLWLEADRMASFKVSPAIFQMERLVVAEEWRLRQNQPYGTMWEEMVQTIFTKHNYQWTPIGNMDHLRAAKASELQDFFNTYYVPNNAVLVVAGNIDVKKTQEQVKRYYGWIPKSPDIHRVSPVEPAQTEARRREVAMRVPLNRIVIGYRMPVWADDDRDALGVLLAILGDGRSSRISQALVTSKDPLCAQADALEWALEDGGFMGVQATLLTDKDIAAVEKILREQIAAIRDQPVTADELAKTKVQYRLEYAKRFETAEQVAAQLGGELLYRGNLDRINTGLARIEAITAADLTRVAKKFLTDEASTTLIIKPDPKAPLTLQPTAPVEPAATVPSSQPGTRSKMKFPTDYPTTPPTITGMPTASFEKGVESTVNGVRTIVMSDTRLPIVHWSLTLRNGSHDESAKQTGLGSLTASMVRRGPVGTTYNAFNEKLESAGISLEVSDGGDFTRLSGSCLAEQLPTAITLMNKMLTSPAFDEAEFASLKNQSLSGLRLALNNPARVADQELDRALFGDSPMGRAATLESIDAITLNDVKEYYKRTYTNDKESKDNAVLIFAGDVSLEDAQVQAKNLIGNITVAKVSHGQIKLPAPAEQRRIILIDRPDARQSNLRMGALAFTLESDEKFAGSIGSQILSAGIDSRLGRYVRAEKGYVYGIGGYFSPSRQAGSFEVSTDTKIETTLETIEACFKVLTEMRTAPVTEKELSETKLRVAGAMLMQMQTTWSQAQRRVDGILNNYPIDYFDVYPQRVAKVTAEDIQKIFTQYVDDSKITLVIVAPADQVKEKLEKLGTVEVLQMPLLRK